MVNFCPKVEIVFETTSLSLKKLFNIVLVGGELALLGFAFVLVCGKGQTPNVPMRVGIKLF
jgi:hypothetical protein